MLRDHNALFLTHSCLSLILTSGSQRERTLLAGRFVYKFYTLSHLQISLYEVLSIFFFFLEVVFIFDQTQNGNLNAKTLGPTVSNFAIISASSKELKRKQNKRIIRLIIVNAKKIQL